VKYLLLVITIILFTSCEEFGCECGDVVDITFGSDLIPIYEIENQCSGERRYFKFPNGVEFETTQSQNLVDVNQNQLNVYCHDTPW